MVRPHQGNSALGTKSEAMAECARVRTLGTGFRAFGQGRRWCVSILGLFTLREDGSEEGSPGPQLCSVHLSIPSSHLEFPVVSP